MIQPDPLLTPARRPPLSSARHGPPGHLNAPRPLVALRSLALARGAPRPATLLAAARRPPLASARPAVPPGTATLLAAARRPPLASARHPPPSRPGEVSRGTRSLRSLVPGRRSLRLAPPALASCLGWCRGAPPGFPPGPPTGPAPLRGTAGYKGRAGAPHPPAVSSRHRRGGQARWGAPALPLLPAREARFSTKIVEKRLFSKRPTFAPQN